MLLIKFLPGRESQPAQNFLEGRILRNDLTGEIREVFGSFFFLAAWGYPPWGTLRRRSQKKCEPPSLADVDGRGPPASEEYRELLVAFAFGAVFATLRQLRYLSH